MAKSSFAKYLRYYDLPKLNDSDEWEIDRRFVEVDYMRKLGQGAFGSVFEGSMMLILLLCGDANS